MNLPKISDDIELIPEQKKKYIVSAPNSGISREDLMKCIVKIYDSIKQDFTIK